MSLQIFLEGKILGVDDCLLAPASQDPDHVFTGRSHWISLLSEVLPRALLAELGLSRILLGSSGGGQFLLVLPGESREPAAAFLQAAAAQISELSGGIVKLIWAVTDNLGDWAVIRRRINDSMQAQRNAPLAGVGEAAFTPVAAPARSDSDSYFAKELGAKVRQASTIGWSPENPGKVIPGEGKHTWPLSSNLSPDGIMVARH